MGDIYKEVGYEHGKTEFGTNPAILVVDLQLGFTDPRYPLGSLPMVDSATNCTAQLLHLARSRGVPVAKCYTAYHSERDMPRWKVRPVHEHFFYGDESLALDPRIHHESYDFTFCKNAPSMFFHTPLITFLAKHKVDTTIITGCVTSGCVRATTVDAFSYGFRVIVPPECVGDADEIPHRQNLIDVHRRYADVVSFDDVMEYLAKVDGPLTPVAG
ncbi:MAG: isochorismatase family protein [Chromatiales bacterium]|nr:isochorismatase family protein [Chromatiales bacterium]